MRETNAAKGGRSHGPQRVNIADWKLHVVVITGVWAVVYPYIAYVNYQHKFDEVKYYYPTSKRIVTHGQWLIPHIEKGTPFLQKPPLGLWFQAVSMEIIGPTLFAARLPSTIIGLLSALLVYHIAKTLYNWRTGFTAGLVFLATPIISIYHHNATTADLDIYLLFFGTAFFWLVWRRSDQQQWMIVAGIAGAAAALSKGLGAGVFLFTLAPIAILHWRQYLSRETFLGGLSGLVVLLPWPIYAYLKHPDLFVQEMVARQISRSQGAFGSNPEALFPTSNYPYFKLLVGADLLIRGSFGLQSLSGSGTYIIRLTYPALLFVAVTGLLVAYRRGVFDRNRDLVLSWWVLSVPVFFSLVGGNHNWYLHPVIIPLAILSALTFDQLADELESRSQVFSVTDQRYVFLVVLTALAIYGMWLLLGDAPKTGPTTL